jgi:hypothetical protein
MTTTRNDVLAAIAEAKRADAAATAAYEAVALALADDVESEAWDAAVKAKREAREAAVEAWRRVMVLATEVAT